jgi:hypothetical protein
MISIHVKLGDAAEYIDIPYAKVVLLGVIAVALYYFVSAGVMHGFTKVFSNGTAVSFSDSLTAVGGKALYDAALLIVSAILSIISGTVGLFVLAAGFSCTYALMVVAYTEISQIKGSFKVYVLAITYVCTLIVTGFMLRTILEPIVSNLFSNAFGSILGDLF